MPVLSALRSRHVRAAAALLCLAAAASCGKVGPPQPPIGRVPTRPNQVTAVQVGNLIRLTWNAPHLDLREDKDSAVQRADVYRLSQTRDQSPITVADELEEAADIIGFIGYDDLKKMLKGGDAVTYDDTLDLSQSALLSNTRFQYAVRYVDRRGRPQVFSNIVSVEPVPGIAKPPTGLAVAQGQDQVTLTWTPPDANIDGTSPAQVVGYNVYRGKPSSDRFGRPLNDKPLADPRFTDKNFIYQTPYVYVVRSVSQAPDALVESTDSERLDVTPRDTFAPSPPTSVTAASAGGVISLFWPTNPESDVVGYFVYRADGVPTEASTWTKLTEKPYTRTTFRDDKVRVGSRYTYRVTAVDRFGNESAPSNAPSETASP